MLSYPLLPTTALCDAFWVHSHNTYQKSVASNFLDVLPSEPLSQSKVKAIEIDIWDVSMFSPSGVHGNWFVRHELIGTNDNNFGNQGLDACLNLLSQWHHNHENHDLLTVFIDKKEGWGKQGSGRDAEGLDQLIIKTIGKENIYKPADLLNESPSLRQAASDKKWLQLKDLKNKFLFVLTGGQLLNHNKTQSEYVNARKEQAVLFVCPDADQSSDVTGVPNQFNDETSKWVVFYNLDLAQFNEETYKSVTDQIKAKHYLAHLWNRDDSEESYVEAISHHINYIGQDQYALPYEQGYNSDLPEGDYAAPNNF